MTVSQKSGPLEVLSSLVPEGLCVTAFTWREVLGQPFQASIAMISEDTKIDLGAQLHQPLSIRLDRADGQEIWFHGLVDAWEFAGFQGKFAIYHATLTAFIGFLEYSGGCRIFQEQSTPDIIQSILGDHGFSGLLEARLSQTYATRPYCVQYAESDLQFLHRLMEEEGIYYFFEYEKDKHTLVLADDLSAHHPAVGYDTVSFVESAPSSHEEQLTEFRFAQRFGTGAVILNDYDFEKPKSPLVVQQNRQQTNKQYQWFQYPGNYSVQGDGERSARIRMEAKESVGHQFRMSGNCRGIRCGNVISLVDHWDESHNTKYLVTSATLSVTTPSGQTDDWTNFDCQIDLGCQMTTLPFRSQQNTPRPLIHGPHVATVTGKEGEEIWTDSYGRIKVQFPWDREGANDENSSCWVRVSQVCTGKNWGSMALPRIGDEVIVEFLDGNPDRPIVTGRVYNADRMPPEILAGAQAKTVFRTRSTKGGDATAFHELTFDDTKDQESIYFHSERDFIRIVENNDSLQVGFEKKSPGDRAIEVYHDQNVIVGKGSGSGSYNLEVQKDFQTKVTTGSAMVEAAKSIVLKCGNSTIELTPSGIKIGAPSIEIKADGAIQIEGATICLKAGSALDLLAGAQATLKSDGQAVIKGSMVMIN